MDSEDRKEEIRTVVEVGVEVARKREGDLRVD